MPYGPAKAVPFQSNSETGNITTMPRRINIPKAPPSRMAILLVTLIVFLGAVPSHAQLDIPGPLHLTHVAGYVYNDHGKPVPNAEITLVRDNAVAYTTRTDKSGAFRIDGVTGAYTFHVGRTAYAPASREINVQFEVITGIERRKLYVIVGPGTCKDECSAVYPSKHEFDRAIKEKNRH
jgi:hypothetical protein